MIESFLLGHTEFVTSFKFSNFNPEVNYYSTSGDGTCIKWEESEIKAQNEGDNTKIAYSLSALNNGTSESRDELVTFALQGYSNPLDNEVEVKGQSSSIVICDSNLNKIKEYNFENGESPLASLGTK